MPDSAPSPIHYRCHPEDDRACAAAGGAFCRICREPWPCPDSSPAPSATSPLTCDHKRDRWLRKSPKYRLECGDCGRTALDIIAALEARNRELTEARNWHADHWQRLYNEQFDRNRELETAHVRLVRFYCEKQWLREAEVSPFQDGYLRALDEVLVGIGEDALVRDAYNEARATKKAAKEAAEDAEDAALGAFLEAEAKSAALRGGSQP